MRIIFFGTSDFAVPAIRALAASEHKILGVVTAPDKRQGRGRRTVFAPVKVFAKEKNLPLVQPVNLKDAEFIQFLKDASADLFAVCAFGKILTKDILQIPRRCTINLHASLLPKYRGAAPINWAIIKGERQTGVTVFKMNEYMDQGEIILQKKTDISCTDTAVTLSEKLSKLGAGAFLEAVDALERGRTTFTVQDERRVSLAPKLKKADGLVNWRDSALEINNRIKGLQPWPGAFTYFGNQLLKIWESKIVESNKDKEPGEIAGVDKTRGILVQTGENKLLITVLQLEGKKRMSATEFILGHKIKTGEKLGG